jgi:chromosomal replication initiation ATPase DnaA
VTSAARGSVSKYTFETFVLGHYAQTLFSGLKVRYVNSEEFTNDFINMIRDGKQVGFRRGGTATWTCSWSTTSSSWRTKPRAHRIMTATIMGQTVSYFGLSIEELCGTSRSRVLVTARHIAMYLCRELTDLSLPKIGQEFGDHTTVINAERKIPYLRHPSVRERAVNDRHGRAA